RRQGRDLHLALQILDRGRAGDAGAAFHVHRGPAANALAARAPEGQRRVDLVLDLDQRVEDHRAAIVEVDGIAVEPRVGARVRIVAINLEASEPLALLRLLGPAFGDLAVPGTRDLGQARDSLLDRAASTPPARFQKLPIDFPASEGAPRQPAGSTSCAD